MVFKKNQKVRNAASQREADKQKQKERRLRDPPDRIRPRASDGRSSSTDCIGSDAGSMFNGSSGAYDDEEALMTQTQAPSSQTQAPSQTQIARADEPEVCMHLFNGRSIAFESVRF